MQIRLNKWYLISKWLTWCLFLIILTIPYNSLVYNWIQFFYLYKYTVFGRFAIGVFEKSYLEFFFVFLKFQEKSIENYENRRNLRNVDFWQNRFDTFFVVILKNISRRDWILKLASSILIIILNLFWYYMRHFKILIFIFSFFNQCYYSFHFSENISNI